MKSLAQYLDKGASHGWHLLVFSSLTPAPFLVAPRFFWGNWLSPTVCNLGGTLIQGFLLGSWVISFLSLSQSSQGEHMWPMCVNQRKAEGTLVEISLSRADSSSYVEPAAPVLPKHPCFLHHLRWFCKFPNISTQSRIPDKTMVMLQISWHWVWVSCWTFEGVLELECLGWLSKELKEEESVKSGIPKEDSPFQTLLNNGEKETELFFF